MLPAGRDGITCPRCKRTTYHPVDVLTGWCMGCDDFTSATDEQVRAAAATLRRMGRGDIADNVIRRLDDRRGL